MAPQADRLVKIGVEGFDLIEKFYGAAPAGRRRSTTTNSNSTAGGLITERPQVSNSKEEVAMINSNDAANRYHGVMIVDYSKPKPRSRWGKIFQAFKF